MPPAEESWEKRKKRLLEEVGMTTIPLGGLSKLTPFERKYRKKR